MKKKPDSTHLATYEFREDGHGPVLLTLFEVLPDGTVKPGSPHEIGITVRRHIGHARTFIAALDWPYLYISRLRGKGRQQQFVVEQRDLTGDPTLKRTLKLGLDAPTALCGLGDRCLVGFKGRVWLVSFEAGYGLKADQFLAPVGPALDKPVDMIVRDRWRIAAIDDIVWPKFAFILSPGKRNTLRHRFTTELPEYPNEWYFRAALSSSCLALTAHYCHRGGTGHRLVVMRLDSTSAQVRAVLQESRLMLWSGEDGTAESLQRRTKNGVIDLGDSEQQIEVLAGQEATPWFGLGIVGPKILVGARKRGVLVLPVKTDGTQRTQLLDLGGDCLDLVSRRRNGFALVRASDANTTSLVPITWNRARRRLETGPPHPLSDNPSRLVI